MRRYQLRQKLLCFGDDFTIKDDQGREVYWVDGKVLTLRDTLIFKTMQGEELARIHRRRLAIGTTYQIERAGRTTTVHKHLFTLLRCQFTVDVPGPDDLEAAGNLTDHEYDFVSVQDGRRIATVSKRWFAFTDTYGVEVADEADDVLILSAAVVIDRCCHEKRD
jgi:uncharacterized protein YxjI